MKTTPRSAPCEGRADRNRSAAGAGLCAFPRCVGDGVGARSARWGVLSIVALLLACGKGAGPEPKNAEKPRAETPVAAAVEKKAPAESGRHLRYTVKFADATAVLDICADGPFARVDQAWEAASGTDKKRWGADGSRMIFDSANRTLLVVNRGKNSFTRIDETRMAKAEDDLEKGTPMGLGNVGVARNPQVETSVGLPAPIAVPLPERAPRKTHPEGCAVFARELPQGLREESCFAPFDGDPISKSYAPFVSLARFSQGLALRVREFEIVAAVADALDWDTGLPVAQFKFGDSPFREAAGAMESWDRTFTLDEQGGCTVLPEDLDPPAAATESFDLLPWPTPFIVTALPK